jgi:D-3-phosphoglycerate dehydrogenase
MKILCYEPLFLKKNIIKLNKYFDLCLSKNHPKNTDEIIGIFTRLSNFLSFNKLKKFKNLKYIISPTTGLNHIELDSLRNKIKIFSLKSSDKRVQKINSTSEFTITLILLAARKILDFINYKKFNSNRYQIKTFQFKNLTVGIIGFGRIGSKVAQILKKIGFNVLIYENNKKKILSKFNFVSLKKLLRNSDIISIHINYNNKNKNFINKKNLIFLKKDSVLINTSRGEVICEKDLVNFLKNNKISKAFLDVISDEQRQFKNKKNLLFTLSKDKLVIFPHLGGATIDAMHLTENIVIDDFVKFIDKNYSIKSFK